MTSVFAKEFVDQSIYRLGLNTPRIEKCLGQLDEAEVWNSPNNNLNSIGNLILHLCGNIRQYAISSLTGVEDKRERDKEFSDKTGQSKFVLLRQLSNTVAEACSVIKNIDDARLTKVYSVQGYNLSGIGIIIHVTEHYSYHTGQIAFWTKLLKDKDLGFYANVDLNVKNKY